MGSRHWVVREKFVVTIEQMSKKVRFATITSLLISQPFKQEAHQEMR